MFSGNSRFKLLRRLGAGGMGVVYEALDQQRKIHVALKTLQQADADLLLRLKHEFRSLRDLVHRNLIGLDELFEEDGHWFFTMELLDGEDLRAYLQRTARTAAWTNDPITPAWEGDRSTYEASTAAGGDPLPPSDSVARLKLLMDDAGRHRQMQPLDFERICEIFGQVTEGLLAIHDAGKIHRDIKPSNIIVTREGRAVILDFGLITEQREAARSGEGEIVGSVPYMAPEQAAAQAVGPAADWYSLGVMLYEVVVGQRPFDGAAGVVLAAKQYTQPPDPRARNPYCPDELADLCIQLLQIDPVKRPQGPEVLRRLGVDQRKATAVTLNVPIAAAQNRFFVGRQAELRELRRAFDDVTGGATITAFVHGESGIGKSTLLQHFVTTVETEHDRTVVLSGQCREHEAVPFKAMDGIIDALSRYVSRLPDVAAAELVPQNAALLAGVFPVLGRISAIAKAPRPLHVATDPFQQRKRVFTALREMLGLLTERYRMIWIIDDMQWVDSDSLRLLEELLRPPDQPRMLLLASVRTAEETPTLPEVPGEVRQIRLQALNPEESVTLTGMLLDYIAPEQKTLTTRIVDETAGHPLFIGELVRYTAADRLAATKQLRLDEAIWARISQLDAASLSVLQILAMAVAPLSEEIIHSATKLDAGEFQKSIALLRASNLIRSAIPTQTSIEIYHDRVRQAVVHHVDDRERIVLNERIAAALETSGAQTQPELLIHHLEGATQFGKAARKALEAAERAQTGLAFDQAIQLYEAALRLGTWSEDERRDILIKLGGTCASAGRGRDAADAYTKAAEGADPTTQLTCRIRVAEQLVQSGRLENGTTLLLSLFQEHGHDFPRSQLQVVLRVRWYRLLLAVRGLRWTDRPPSEISPRDLAILALYKAASRGLLLVDPFRAAYFVIRGLHLAMDIGDRNYVMDFLILEVSYRVGEESKKHAKFIRAADAIIQDHADPLFQTTLRLDQGVRAYRSADQEFKRAFEILDRSDAERVQMANAAWELSVGRFFLTYSLHKMGDFAKLRTYTERFIRDAEQRGNVYARTTISRLRNIMWLVDDNPQSAREALEIDSWFSYSQGYHAQHLLELNARVEIAIYEGTPVDPKLLSQHLRGLRRSSLPKIRGYACDTAWLMGRMALSELSQDPLQRRVAQQSIARLRSYDTQYSRVLASALHATLAMHDGDIEGAVAELRQVVAAADATNLYFIAAAARRRLGTLIGGEEGRELVAAGERWMTEAGIKNFDRMTNLVSPIARPGKLLRS